MYNYLEKLYANPHKVFLWIALFFGVVYVLVTPPMRAPDEGEHLSRIITLSENNKNREIPELLEKFINEKTIAATSKNKINYKFSENYKNNYVDIDYSKKIRSVYDSATTYSFIPYITELPVMAAGIKIRLSPSIIFYTARFILFLTGTLLIYYSIKIIPVAKWTILFVALFPTSVFVRSSVSADPVTVGILFIYIAIILDVYFSDALVTHRKKYVITFIATALCLTKIAYVFMPLLFFILPKKKFSSKSSYIISVVMLAMIPVITGMVWGVIKYEEILLNPIGNNITKPSNMGGEKLHDQFNLFVSNPIIFPRNIIITWIFDGKLFLKQIFGVTGLLDTYMPNYLYYMAYIILFLVIFADQNHYDKIKLHFTQKFVFLLVFVITFLSIHFLLFIGFNNDTKLAYIYGVQGRYFTPTLPLLFTVLLLPAFSRKVYLFAVSTILLFIAYSLTDGVFCILQHDYATPENHCGLT